MAEKKKKGEEQSEVGGGTAATKPKRLRKVAPRQKPPQMLPPWKVLLHNDDKNEPVFVIEAIVQLTPLNKEDAQQRMVEAHKLGVALLLTTHKERAELYKDQFETKGLTVSIEPANQHAMTAKLIHSVNEAVELHFADKLLFRYVYAPTFDPWESRKPYMHPIRTLAGNEITCYRPHDHVWHKGMQMTMAHLSGQNFWGGFSYVRGEGYVKRENIGRMQHVAWEELSCDGAAAVARHRLQWITQAQEHWIDEVREIRVSQIKPDAGYWAIDWRMELTNVRGEMLRFGSPTTEGRVNAGYGGLFWRGPRSFLHGSILADGKLQGPEVMGQHSPWIAFIGKHDGTGGKSTILFIDRPGNAGCPVKWFVRNDPFACIAAAFSFDEEIELPPGRRLVLDYRTVFADGEWPRETIEQFMSSGASMDD